jgi:hypothetical protein
VTGSADWTEPAPAPVGHAGRTPLRIVHARLSGELTADAWICARRTPRYHPDAVTLSTIASVDHLLDRIRPLPSRPFGDLEADVRQSMARIEASPFASGETYGSDSSAA